MARITKRYGVRNNSGQIEMVWMDHVYNGFWRGWRFPDGRRTRGPVHALLGRFETQAEAQAFMGEIK